MSKTHEIKVTKRELQRKGASRRLRHAGKVPAIVYGGGSDPRSIQLEHEKTWVASQKEWFYSSIIDLDVDGKVEKVYAVPSNERWKKAGREPFVSL